MYQPLLDISNLMTGYGEHTVISHLSFSIAEGDRIAVIGPNGCGKSTLLRAVTGEIKSTAGHIRFKGAALNQLPTDVVIRQGIGYLRQTRNVFPSLPVDDNLELAGTGNNPEDQKRKLRLMEFFPILSGCMQIRAGLLSGGERKALAVAMVLMKPVSLLLLDEPVAGLSQKAANEILQGLDALQREEGFATLVIEHRLQQIQPWVTRVIIMVRGEIMSDTNDTSILGDRARLEDYYLL